MADQTSTVSRLNDAIETPANSGAVEVTTWAAEIARFSTLPLYRNNHVELLIDGPATYKRMLECIGAARQQVYLETYIFADDEIGRQFASLLKEKSRAGVTVGIIYDSIGSIRADGHFFDDMKREGIRVIEFNDVSPGSGNLLKLNNRAHRKLLIVDSRIAFTGGINLSSTYSSSSNAASGRNLLLEGWRDTQIAVTGPVVEGFLRDFSDRWHRLSGQRLRSKEHQSMDRRANSQQGNETVAILTATGGDDRKSAIISAYKAAIRRARERVWITQAYFAPARGFVSLLRKAARRGVDVRIIVPGVSDSPIVRHASRSWYGKLLRKQVRIYECTNALLHAKTAVIDGIWSTVGTSNLDYRSFLHNDEINAVILGRGFARRMEAQFEEDIANSVAIDLETWKRRPFLDKIVERFSRSLEYWL
jgi:cardiolipin synthase